MTDCKRMLVLCPFPQGVAAGQRLKYEQYFADWSEDGWEITVSSFMDMAMWRITYEPGHLGQKISGTMRGYGRRLRDLFRIPRYDLVYVFMWVTPFGVSLEERLVRGLAQRVIYDVEDNILVEQNLPKEMNPNPVARLIKGPGKARYLIRTADHVITSSPFLNDFCMGLNARKACTYVSSSVDTDNFKPARRSDSSVIVIGWTGTYSSRIYLDLLRDVFLSLAQKVNFRLRVIGNFDYDLPGVDLEVVRWSKEREVQDMQAIDVGVYPLPMDDWVLGKSGLKAIQYMAFGMACVATDVGTTPLLIRDGENGLLVRTDEDWISALERLVKDAELRARLGKAARKDAVERYSTHAIAANYRVVLDDVMGQIS